MEIEKRISHEIFKNKNILQNIFLKVANINTNKDTVSKDLYQLLFVCKTWYEVSVPILYSKIIYNGGITRGVYHGTCTRLETIAKFINKNKKQSIEYQIYNYFNNINDNHNNNSNKMECSPATSSQLEVTKNNNLFRNLEFSEIEENRISVIDSEILYKIKSIINNINSLKNIRSSFVTEQRISEIQKINKNILYEISDLTEDLYKIYTKIEIENENIYRKLLEGIEFLKLVNDNLVAALPSNNTHNINNTLFVPDIYSKVRTFFFNKTDQLRTVDQLFSYKRSYLEFIGNCENITILSFGSKHDKQHLLMEKDLFNLFSTHSFPHLRYLVFNNLQYITGETSFNYIPSNIEALRIDYCNNVTVDSIIALIQRIGPKLKLLSLKDSTITVELLHTIIKRCKRLIYVDISYNKAEKDYVKKVFRTQIQNVIKLNKNLRMFNVYGILDLKNIQKTEQLYPQVKLYNNENLKLNNDSIGVANNTKIMYNYLENDLNIKFKYSFELPKQEPDPSEMEDDNDDDVDDDNNDNDNDDDDVYFDCETSSDSDDILFI
ncbi:hypothetical protein PIROE2DRAFT_8667 [Piromyces sp. E2]|nr:hypothetical protein PIROE2DRAFT_8667 [Piromyces sp. E2]|eukprot:OUM64509.1 hypothetical protein PIROE2DRAFT_8667 [Piromyces sp. E2]